MIMAVNQTKKTGKGKAKLTQEKKKNQKWLKLMSQKRP
jgi:hypothetical protein